MGDYLEEILDGNDLEMEIMIALDEGEALGESRIKELLFDDELFDELSVEDYYE